MPTIVHFLNVGQGNMTLLQLANGQTFLYDCNVTNDNEDDVLRYLERHVGAAGIDVFVCSHRDADHMRGIKKVHAEFPVKKVWDSGAVGTTPDCREYREYMALRRSVGFVEVERLKRWDFGNTRLRILNSKNDDLPDEPNVQSIVIKVVHRDAARNVDFDSVMLTGDTDAAAWKCIQDSYGSSDLSCSLLLGSHHGSITYFDDPADEKFYYLEHLTAKSPKMTILSVGDNAHGHPHPKALEYYERHSSGSSLGNKLYRTDEHGHIRAVLKDGGGWSVTKNM